MKRSAEGTLEGSRKRFAPTRPSPNTFVHRRGVSELHGAEDEGYIVARILQFFSKLKTYKLSVPNGEEHNFTRNATFLDLQLEGTWDNRIELLVQDELQISLKGVGVIKPRHPQSPITLKYSNGIAVRILRRPGSPQDSNKFIEAWQVKRPQPKINSIYKGIQEKADCSDWYDAPPVPAVPPNLGDDESDATAINRASPNSTRSSTVVSLSSPIDTRSTSNQELIVSISNIPHISRNDATTREFIMAHTEYSPAPPSYRVAPTDAALAKPISIPADATSFKSEPLLTNASLTAGPSVSVARRFETPMPASGPLADRRRPGPTSAVKPTTSDVQSALEHTGAPQEINRSKKSKREKRADKQKQKQQAHVSTASKSSPLSPRPVPSIADRVPISVPDNMPSRSEIANRAPHEDSKSDLIPSESTATPESKNPMLSMKAGLRAEAGYYTPMANIESGKLVSIIGVVTSAREITQTFKGDFSQCLTLLDPSNLDEFGGYLYIPRSGTKVNCFMKLRKEWLPMPDVGDVVILRSLRASEFNGQSTLTGFADRLQWAIYDALTGQAKPVVTNTDGGSQNSVYSPIWTPCALELAYCARLASWWKAVQEERKLVQGQEIQIGGGDAQAPMSMSHHGARQHRLIRDADPRAPPDGYFDCTVEILYCHSNDNGPHSVYVTDYTAKEGTYQNVANWCPANLSNQVLKIEMWFQAATLAQSMQRGQYWFIGNVRMKMSTGGFLEGTFSETRKAERLDESQADQRPTLKALLERKKAWDETNTSPHQFTHKLLSEISVTEIFDCTVELLHADYDFTGFSTIYVTDHTTRKDLQRPPTADWVKHSKDQIVTIALRDNQNDMAKQMEPGCFYHIAHLRLMPNATNYRLFGKLGGCDRLISQLNAKSTDNKDLVALLERKKTSATAYSIKSLPSISSNKNKSDGFSSIKEVVASDRCPGRFRIQARVVDFAPLDLKDCSIKYCTNCRTRIPTNHRACTTCNDTLKKHVVWIIKLFFRLRDDHGDELVVAVDETWPILAGLSPVDFSEDSDALEDIIKRMRPYIGNLIEVHEAFFQNEELPLETSLSELTVASWLIPDGKGERAYGLK